MTRQGGLPLRFGRLEPLLTTGSVVASTTEQVVAAPGQPAGADPTADLWLHSSGTAGHSDAPGDLDRALASPLVIHEFHARHERVPLQG